MDQLARDRANACLQALIKEGVDPKRLWIVAVGRPATFRVQASRAQVEAAIEQLGAAASCVRLLIVNDTHTCIVAGKPEQCKALVAHLGCDAMPIEQGMAGHCKEAEPFRDEIARGAPTHYHY